MSGSPSTSTKRQWVTLALIPQLPAFGGKIWEPACGSGKMVAALTASRFRGGSPSRH
jgi:hypothetical protein